MPSRSVDPSEGSPPLREVLEALVHPRRRAILYYLQDHTVATVDELARQVAAREAATLPEAVSADTRERVEVELIHRHLPKLADSSFIEYDKRSATVTYSHPSFLLAKVLQFLAQLEAELPV